MTQINPSFLLIVQEVLVLKHSRCKWIYLCWYTQKSRLTTKLLRQLWSLKNQAIQFYHLYIHISDGDYTFPTYLWLLWHHHWGPADSCLSPQQLQISKTGHNLESVMHHSLQSLFQIFCKSHSLELKDGKKKISKPSPQKIKTYFLTSSLASLLPVTAWKNYLYTSFQKMQIVTNLSSSISVSLLYR